MQKYSKVIVVLVILLNVGFVYFISELMKVVGFEPTSLIVAWFSFTTVELWSLASITKKKVETERRDERGD